MPGAYTHITMANVAGQRRVLQAIAGFPHAAITACGEYRGFCELGAVSPDYPYLDLLNGEAKKWADVMHYERTGEVIKSAARRIRTMSGTQQQKCLAWLLGYTAHVVMDVTIHPVVNLRVGEYATHQKQHRTCEMNQDVHIFSKLMNLKVGYAEHLDQGIGRCSSAGGGLDDDVRRLWLQALEEVHQAKFTSSPPEPDGWHSWFKKIVDNVAENRLLSAVSRHIAPGGGFTYPSLDELDLTFIENLAVPGGRRMHFDEVFNLAKGNVLKMWEVVAHGALGDNDDFEHFLGNWDLDTGLDTATQKSVFWGN